MSKQIIQISEAAVTSNRRRRLNLFPGRAMSEQAFDFVQDYAEDRLDPLLVGSQPGIVQGLEVSHQLTAADDPPDSTGGTPAKVDMLRVNPGLAVAPHGEALSLYFPLQQPFESVVLEYRRLQKIAQPVSGIFFLTLYRGVASVDASMDVDACHRTEPDPLRDMRLETVTRMGLQMIDPSPELQVLAKEKVANRYLAYFTRNSWADETSHELPVAMVAVRKDKLLWLDPLAGRFERVPYAQYQALLNHMLEEFRRAARLQAIDGNKHWPKLEYLPAAGQLPSDMLVGVEGDEPPKLLWIPKDIQVDMVPLPDSRVPTVIQRELPRGVIDLRERQDDRIRLLIAIPDQDFKPDLLDLPSADHALEEELYRRGKTAHESWADWKEQFLKLFHIRQKVTGGDDTTLTEREIKALAIPTPVEKPLPVTNYSNKDSRTLTQDEREQFGIPDPEKQGMLLVLSPQNSLAGWSNTANFSLGSFFDSQIRKRAEAAKLSQLTELPLPYRWGIPLPAPEFTWYGGVQPPVPALPATAAGAEQHGLVIRHAETENSLEQLKEDVAEGRKILDRMSDFIQLQRQQLDAQSVSFTTLAGGVSGDGSGLQIARWLPHTELAAPVATEAKAAEEGGSAGDGGGGGFSIGAYSMPLMMYNSPPQSGGSDSQKSGTTYSMMKDYQYSKGSDLGSIGTTENIASKNWGETPLYQMSILPDLMGFNYSQEPAEAKLDQIAIRNNPISDPLFISANHNFGVLGHILPIVREYNNAFSGFKELRESNTDLFEDIKEYVDGLVDGTELNRYKQIILELLDERLSDAPAEDGKTPKRIWYRTMGDLLARNALVVGEDGTGDEKKATKSRHLFNAGKVLVSDIGELEKLHTAFRALYRLLNRRAKLTNKELKKLAAEITKARSKLYALDAPRREALSDYALAQQLIIEEWRQVEARYLERQRILKSHQGLYYVRVRETPLSLGLPDPLSLRFGTDADPVPGCSNAEPMIPDELTPFQEAVLDIPLRDWRGLTNHWHLLPGRLRIASLLERRKVRIKSRVDLAASVESSLMIHSSGLRLQSLYQQNRTVLHQFSKITLQPSKSLAEFQRNSTHVLSLEDVLNGPPHRLRRQAEKLRSQLDRATSCLLEQLLQLPPSIRLKWAEEAEENRLRVNRPESWPMLQQAEQRDFDAVRTILELVQWLFRQLDSDATAASHTALSNLVRACLLEAASDDPGELLQGKLLIAPGRLRLGATLRLKLNREALPGVRLQLFDDAQRVVGAVRIEDEDDQGAVAQVIDIWDQNAILSTNSHVAGFIRMAGK